MVPAKEKLRGSLLLGVTITALNASLIGTWAAATATLFSTGLVQYSATLAAPFAIAACVGIMGWFFVLVKLVEHYRDRFSQESLFKVVRVIGAVLVCGGCYFFYLFMSYIFLG